MLNIDDISKTQYNEDDLLQERARLYASPLLFTRLFYKLKTGRDFVISEPPGRESHYITIFKALKRVFSGEINRLIINIPPRYGKTECIINFIAWAQACYPDSHSLYVSYSHTLAKKQTQTIRDIINMPEYRRLFGVGISQATSAKDNFETNTGGSVYAAGAGGPITGRGAGIQHTNRYGGAIIIDDIHKPIEVNSDTLRLRINDWYYNTLQSRTNNPNTPIVIIGQRLHEDDLIANLINKDEWHKIVLPALDEVGNPLHPAMHTKEMLLKMKEERPYEFAAQYQQDPQPAGGSIFKPEWFPLLDEEPEIISTFITVDTAETALEYNDATVFSFWGLHKISNKFYETDLYGLYWIDCRDIRVEPKDLESEFMDFYSGCMRYKVKPNLVAVEKKSTGVTLGSVLNNMPGLNILDIKRTELHGFISDGTRRASKISRFLETQPYIATKRISLPRYGKHTHKCIEHCKKITANNSHAFDDIADTLADAVWVGLISEIVPRRTVKKDSQQEKILTKMIEHDKNIQNVRARTLWQ